MSRDGQPARGKDRRGQAQPLFGTWQYSRKRSERMGRIGNNATMSFRIRAILKLCPLSIPKTSGSTARVPPPDERLAGKQASISDSGLYPPLAGSGMERLETAAPPEGETTHGLSSFPKKCH